MSCVNTKTKEFKEASIRNNINEATLEAIVHAFQNTEGNENLFPSDGYIKSQLQGLAMTNASASQIRLWKNRYRKPIIAKTLNDAERIVKEAKKYFNTSSIVMYQTRDGNYRITVARPTQNRGKLMYQKSSDTVSNLKRVKEHYRESLNTKEKQDSYNETIKSIRALYTRKVYYPINNESSSNVDIRLSNIIRDIMQKSGWAIRGARIVNLKNGGKRIQLDFKDFNEILNEKLSIIDSFDEDTLASEALRLEQESVINEEYYINKKKVEALKAQVAKKNEFITQEAIEEAFKFLEELENDKDLNQYVDTCIRWLKNNTISLPRDNKKVLDAFMLARKKNIDTQKFNSPIDLILWEINNREQDIEEGQIIEPHNIDKLSYNRTINTEEGIIEIFDVEDSEEGQTTICQILADTSPKIAGKPVATSPWCLSTFNYNKETKKATPTESAKGFWEQYSNGKRQIAFLNGKPLAFNSSSSTNDEWWDFYDGSNNGFRGFNTVEECDKKATLNYYKESTSRETQEYSYIDLGPFSYTIVNKKLEHVYAQRDIRNNKGRWLGTVIWSREFNNKERVFRVEATWGFIKLTPTQKVIHFDSFNRNAFKITKTGIYLGRIHINGISYSVDYSNEKEAFILSDALTNEEHILFNYPKVDIDKFLNIINNVSLDEYPSKSIQESLLSFLKSIDKPMHNAVKEFKYKKIKEEENKDKKEEKKEEVEIKAATTSTQAEVDDAITVNNTVNALNSLDINSNLEYTSTTEEELPYQDVEVINEEDLEYIGNEVNEYNINEEPIEPTTIVDTLEALREGKLEQLYNEGVKKPFNKELSQILHDILKAYHFEIIEGDLKEVFGEDTLGALDILQKIVYLANEGDRNALTDAEEFAHAFIELMGSAYHKNTTAYPATKEYTELRDLIEQTTLYQSTLKQYRDVYTYANGDPDLPLIKKEALGKALAAVIRDRYEAKTEADNSFIAKLKNWFKDVLLYFKKIFKDEAKLQYRLNQIADSILDGTYVEKYLNKVDDTDYKLVDFKDTLINQNSKDGGKALGIIQIINRLKGKVTGSLAYRAQGTVYRREIDSLHDLDFVFDANSHDVFTSHPSLRTLRRISPNRWWTLDRIKEAVEQSSFAAELKRQVPDLTIMYAYPGPNGIIVNAVVSEDQDLVAKFMSLEGNFNTRLEQLTQEERDKLYLLDFFLNKEDSYESFTDEESGIEMVDYTVPFESKLKFGRAKDIYDYQRFNPTQRRYKISPSTMFQKKVETKSEELSKEEQEITEVQEEQQDPFLQESLEITRQIDNLLNSSIITASEVRHIAEQAVYWISDHITEIQRNPELAVTIYGDRVKGNDFANMGRQEIIQAIGPSSIMAMCKEKFRPRPGKYQKSSTTKKARLIVDNWEAIMKFATDTFSTMEDFSITRIAGRDEVLENDNIDVDNYNESNDKDEIAEVQGDTQEHWQIENRTIDVLYSMSQLVKHALRECYQLDNEGNKIKSEFGINERIDVIDATSSILRWTQGALTLKDMINKLEAKKQDNPWISQIIDRLNDDSGNESDFQSQFFSVFCKHFQSYSIVTKRKGKYISIQVNEFPALREAYNSITTLFKINEHPMFTSEGVNKKTFKEFKSVYEELLPLRRALNNENKGEIARKISFIANTLGYYYATPEIIESILDERTFRNMLTTIGYMVKAIEENLDNKNYTPFEFKSKGSISGNIRMFLRPITDKLEDTAVSSFYDSGKMYQSYVTPSYMTKLMNKFNLTGEEFDAFIMDEYGKYSWFRDTDSDNIEDGWRNSWLRELVLDENAKTVFKHKVQLNFNKHNYMRNMNDSEYILSMISEYFSESSKEGANRVPAWYRVPVLSNKPSSEFIRFYSERGANYKDIIASNLKMVFDQELSRIQTVLLRNYSESDPEFIKNFDKNGKRFNFLSFMNDYLDGELSNTELGKLIKRKLDGEQLTSEENTTLDTLVIDAIKENMDRKANAIVSDWRNKGVVEGAKQIENVGTEESEIIDNLINFVWNDTLAAINIMQLTITDAAYYKDAEDIQKRFAQIHAPGVRGNVDATDYNGNAVSDGTERTLYLKDFDDFVSNIIENVSIVFDRKIEAAPESEKAQWIALKESLVGEKGAFREINVADAQGYNSPTSYRKKAFIFGKWSRQAEEIYQKLKKGEYTYSDLQVAFQPLKPFVYSQISKNSNTDAPLSELKVPVQNKNSEYLLILADAILQGEDTGRPNLLRAVYEVMEESADKNPTKGIDTIQFESTVKSGLMGAIDIKQFSDMEGGEAAAKKLLEDSIYNEDGSYNPTFIHEIPFEDYCLQQEIPDHFKQHEQAHGSQIRYIVPSDLEEVDYLGNPVTYEVEGRQLTAEEFKIEYENTIAENINESIENLTKELHLDDTDIKARNIALSKILQREILSSPRYGVDLFQACSLDENGNFRIPLGDPIQSKRVEQLINSIIKNRVNKQTIAGGPVVQVSNFGLSKDLNIRFKSKDGKMLMTKAEYAEKMAESWKLQGHTDMLPMSRVDAQYKEYLRVNQAGIAYFEVFAPIYTKEIFEKFQNPDGSIDMEAIEALHPDLLKMVGYRIPTEDKYSCAPLKIVGFLPREAGDGIMLPSDITLLSGSDFDIDKMYLMLKNIPIRMRNREDVYNDMFDALVASRAKTTTVTSKIKQSIREELNMFMNNPQIMKNADALHQYMWKLYKRFAYEAVPPTQGREYRNNKIVDMSYAILTHETTADKILNPGGFEPQKRMGYMVEAYRNHANEGITWEQLEKMSIKELSELAHTNKNLSFIDAQIHFYKQNSSGSTLIGIFAVHKVAHAVLEGDNFMLNIEEVCSLEEGEFFNIAGTSFGETMVIDPKYDINGQLIGKSLGSNVAASADTGKFPVLDLNNINPTTANIVCALERLGMPYDTIALFLSQSTISNILNTYNTENINGFARLGDIISKRLSELEDELFIETYSDLNKEDLSKEELIEGILPNPKPEIEYKVLRAFQRVQKIGEAIRGITFATRFNSISSAVGPLIIDNLITEHKLKNFSSSILKPNGESADIVDVFTKHPILNQFFRTLNMAKYMFGNMPANSRGFRNILDSMDDNLSNLIYSDRKLLSNFSDFYQSYLLIASGAVNEKQLVNYINGFPTWFFKQNFKEKYKDNALIHAIKLDTDSTTNRPILKVDITGLKTKQKEVLMNAWIDLYKENQELAKQLFMYNFFRRGIGFSPEAFMNLVPTYIKERIEGYTDTYRKLPSVSGALVIDQFIRNNWDNNKLVPRKKVKLVWHDKIAEITNPKEVKEMKNVPYFKIKIGNTDRLFKQTESTETSVFYEEITPLGNNGEYLEISNSHISNPITIPNVAKEDISNSEISESSNQDVDIDNPISNIETRTEEQETLDLLYQLIENGKNVTSKEQAISKVEEFKSKSEKDKKALESGMKKYFRNRLINLNIPFDESKIDKIYNKMCK